MNPQLACLSIAIVGIAACVDGEPNAVDAAPRTQRRALAPSDPTSVAPRPVTSPSELWNEFVSAHASATPTNVVTTGQRIDVLLSEDARRFLNENIPRNATTAAIDHSTIRYKLLGESAVVRRARFAAARLEPIEYLAEDRAVVRVYYGDALSGTFPVIRERGQWRFQPSPHLVATPDELYPTPKRRSSVLLPSRTIEDLGDALVEALNSADPWALHDLAASATKNDWSVLLEDFDGADEVFLMRALGNLLRDRQTESGPVRLNSTTRLSADAGEILVAHNDGTLEIFRAVREHGRWLVEVRY